MKILRKALEWALIAPALLPLFFIDGFIYPYLAPKILLFRGLGVVLASLIIFFALRGEPFFWHRLKNKFSWLAAALLAVAYITSLVGIDFYRSFWSTYSRGDGLLTLTVVVLYFYAILIVADERFIERFLKVVACVATLVSVQALVEWLSQMSGAVIPFVPQVSGRVEGTLGNPAFLACYLGITLFITLAVARSYTGRWRTFLYISAALQAFDVLLTATRGTIVALGVVLLLSLIYYSWSGPKRVFARSALGGLVIVIVLFVLLRAPLSHVPIAWVSRLATVSLSDPTVSSRFFLWQHLSTEALKRPIVGYGAEHIDVSFNKVYDPTSIVEQWFDRAHNSYLDYVLQFGVVGLLLYIGIIAGLISMGWRIFNEGSERGVWLIGAGVVYGVQNFFVFDTGLILWTLLMLFAISLVPRAVKGQQKEVPSALPQSQPMRAAGATVAIALLYFLWPVSIEPWRANLALTEGYVDQVADVNAGIAAMQSGYALNTYADLEYGYEVYAMYTGTQLSTLTGDDLVAAYQFAESTLESNYKRYPFDARTALYLAHVLDSTPPSIIKNTTLLNEAADRSIELSPKRDQAWYIKANVPLALGDAAKTAKAKAAYYAQAIELLSQYAEAAPENAGPHYIIATLYLTLGDRASANEWAQKGLAVYKKIDPTIAKRAAKYYIAIEDWPHAVQFLSDVVEMSPDDLDSTYDLAKASLLSGDRDRALRIVEQLRQASPGFVEKDPAFLKALGE